MQRCLEIVTDTRAPLYGRTCLVPHILCQRVFTMSSLR
jgi:hypothetical protein